MLTLIIGGARSGKSSAAQARFAQAPRVVYIATAQSLDTEMERRIAQHRAERPAGWITIEEPLNLRAALEKASAQQPDAILIDCLTLWLSNRLLPLFPDRWTSAAESALLAELEEAVAPWLLPASPVELLVVSNEVGQGIVPENALARAFRDLSGRANQRLAQQANTVLWMVAGIAVPIKPSR